MVEAAVWLVYEAWKLLRPVAERVVADTQQDAADWTEKKATRWVKRVITPADAVPRPLQADGGDVAAPDEAVGATDDAIVTALEQDPSTAEDLRQVAEGVLGVSLGGAGVVPGSDAWFVSAYEALLWRAAVMAGWEGSADRRGRSAAGAGVGNSMRAPSASEAGRSHRPVIAVEHNLDPGRSPTFGRCSASGFLCSPDRRGRKCRRSGRSD